VGSPSSGSAGGAAPARVVGWVQRFNALARRRVCVRRARKTNREESGQLACRWSRLARVGQQVPLPSPPASFMGSRSTVHGRLPGQPDGRVTCAGKDRKNGDVLCAIGSQIGRSKIIKVMWLHHMLEK